MPNDDNKYIFYCFDNGNPVQDLAIDTQLDYSIVSTKTLETVLDSPKDILGILKLIYHQFQPLQAYQPDVFVQFDFNLGLPRWHHTKKIVIGYDLIPLVLKEDYLPGPILAVRKAVGKKAKVRAVIRSVYYRFRYWVSCKAYKRADTILCISQATAESFRRLLNIDDSKIEVIPLAPVLPKISRTDKTILKNIDKPYMFYIGGTDPRKSLEDIVLAFNAVKDGGTDIKLVLAGNELKKIRLVPDVKGRNAILRSAHKSDIHLVGRVTDAEKMALYESALAFVFASTYEGFGMPVLEAMSAGCPVIAYDNSSIPEAMGNAGILVPSGNYLAIADEVVNLTNKKTRRHFAAAGRRHAKEYTWTGYIKAFTKALDSTTR